MLSEPRYEIEVSNYTCERCGSEIPEGETFYSGIVYADDAFRRRNYCPPCWTIEGPEAGDRAGETEARANVPYYAHWRSRRPVPARDERPRVRFDPGLILEFFRRLENAAEPQPAGTKGTETEADVGSGGPAESGASLEERTACAAGVAEGDRAASSDTEVPSRAATPQPGAAAAAPGFAAKRREIAFVLALLLVRAKRLRFEGTAVKEGREYLELRERDDPGRTYWVETVEMSDEELERARDAVSELLDMEV